MIGPRHPDTGLAEQLLPAKIARALAEGADGDIGSAGLQVIAQPVIDGAQPHLRGRRLATDAAHHRRHEQRAHIGSARKGKAPPRRRRGKVGRSQGQLQLVQALAQARRDLLRPRRGSHPFGAADKELILQDVTQAIQRMAHR